MKRTFLFFKVPTMSRNSASLRRLSLGSSVVCVRSPVKTMKSDSNESAFTAATAFGFCGF